MGWGAGRREAGRVMWWCVAVVCVVWLSDHSLTCAYRSYIKILGLIITTNAISLGIRYLNYSFTIAAKILSLFIPG